MNTKVLYTILAIMAVAIIYLYAKPDNSEIDWKSRVAHYEQVSDSLQRSLDDVIAQTKEKDSVLLLYMVSLDKTLEELNKEARKNTTVINRNAQVQDSLISTYCQEMIALNQTPEVCK